MMTSSDDLSGNSETTKKSTEQEIELVMTTEFRKEKRKAKD